MKNGEREHYYRDLYIGQKEKERGPLRDGETTETTTQGLKSRKRYAKCSRNEMVYEKLKFLLDAPFMCRAFGLLPPSFASAIIWALLGIVRFKG